MSLPFQILFYCTLIAFILDIIKNGNSEESFGDSEQFKACLTKHSDPVIECIRYNA